MLFGINLIDKDYNTMNIEGVIITDEKAKKVFAFVRQFPAVCAQADTEEEVKIKIETNFRHFVEWMNRK